MQRLAKQHADDLEKTLKKQLAAQQKQLEDKAATDRKSEVKQLREVWVYKFVFAGRKKKPSKPKQTKLNPCGAV